jgi:solute carrier family 25 S-adenosylmethionine transporter 26
MQNPKLAATPLPNSPPTLPLQSQSFLSIPSRLARIAQTEGAGALFSGVVPRTLWISAGGAVFLGVYEASAGVLKGVV